MDDRQPRPIEAIDHPGFKADHDLAFVMRKEVAGLLHREKIDFPGAQPISFARHHLDELRSADYYVCEKSDGIRYLLYLSRDGDQELCYLIDRKNDYWHVPNLHFPRIENQEDFHVGTLLDGELVLDDLGGGKKEPRYLVFDCLVLDGQDLMSRELNKRLGYFTEQIFKPYNKLYEKYPDEKKYRPFALDMKDMQVAYGIVMMFHQIIPNLKHGNDGLIFTCLKSDYKHGTDEHILKWKPADENTVDFLWRLHFRTVEPDELDRAEGITAPYVDYDGVPDAELLVYHGGSGPDSYRPFGDLHLADDEWEELKALGEPLNERIVEAYMDDQKRWRFYRFRDDKQHGNFHTVVSSVLESIRDGVSRDDLINAAKSIRDNWKQRELDARQQREQEARAQRERA